MIAPSRGVLALVVCLLAACNPFEALEPTAASTAGPSATDEMCAANKNLGRCPPPPPKDFTH